MLYTCSFFSFLQSHYLLFFIKYYLVTIQASFSLSDTSVNHDEFINNTIKGYTWEVEWGWLVKAIEKSLKSLKIRGWCLKSPKNWWGYWYMTPNVFFFDQLLFRIHCLSQRKKHYDHGQLTLTLRWLTLNELIRTISAEVKVCFRYKWVISTHSFPNGTH